MAGEIGELERRPAHLTQSVEESSLDAWLEKYDYYRLPASAAFRITTKEICSGVLLDLELREATHGSASIRDLFRWMNENYARKGRFFPDSEGVRRAAEAVSHADLGWFFQKYVAGTEEIPWDDFFRSVGLHLSRRETFNRRSRDSSRTQNFDAAPVVARRHRRKQRPQARRVVRRRCDSWKSTARAPTAALAGHLPANCIPARLCACGSAIPAGERELQWALGARQELELELIDLDKITPEQQARRAAWLKGEDQAAGGMQP